MPQTKQTNWRSFYLQSFSNEVSAIKKYASLIVCGILFDDRMGSLMKLITGEVKRKVGWPHALRQCERKMMSWWGIVLSKKFFYLLPSLADFFDFLDGQGHRWYRSNLWYVFFLVDYHFVCFHLAHKLHEKHTRHISSTKMTIIRL